MTAQAFFKGLLMMLVGVVTAAFTQTPINYLLLAVTALCAILTYTGKNLIAVLHSDSPAGALSWINLVSGLLVALGTGILEAAGTFLVEGIIIWSLVWKVVLSVTFTYLGSTFFAPEHGAVTKGFVKGWRLTKKAA